MTKKICVFCGSNSGYNEIYANAAKQFAKEIVKNNMTLVYGGGKVGIMGIISKEIMDNGGKVIGVIPEFLNNMNLGNKNLTEMRVVSDMHVRKKTMYEISDYFVALPGGIGTFEEITEIITWKQLNIHNKPVAILNINKFYDNYINLLQKSVDEGFMKQIHVSNIIVESDCTKLIDRLKSAKDKQELKFI